MRGKKVVDMICTRMRKMDRDYTELMGVNINDRDSDVDVDVDDATIVWMKNECPRYVYLGRPTFDELVRT